MADAPSKPLGLQRYNLLGRTGLRVSPIALGTGTFGDKWGAGWTTEEKVIREIVFRYLDAGGNHLDTANAYHAGLSEEWTGKLLKESGRRDRVVIATKFTLSMHLGDPNGAGNGRKNIIEAAEASLRRLQTDYIDLYYMHWWDALTPADEVMAALNGLVQSGKVRYIALSNPPAWYATKAQLLAQFRGWEPLAGLQMQYNLLVRDIEHEYIDLAREFGIGLVPWSPLANGLLSGKYTYADDGRLQGAGRYVDGWVTDPTVDVAAHRTRATLEALAAVAKEIGRSQAQVALNWVANRPAVVSTIIGATKLTQLEDNIAALDFEIPAPLVTKLDMASKNPPRYPYTLTSENNRKGIVGSAEIRRIV